jgi:hypothetical protein
MTVTDDSLPRPTFLPPDAAPVACLVTRPGVYANEVGPQHVGRRVTIRHAIVDDVHAHTDAVGVLERWDDDGQVAVRRRDGSLDDFPAGSIIASRLLPDPPFRPSARG